MTSLPSKLMSKLLAFKLMYHSPIMIINYLCLLSWIFMEKDKNIVYNIT